MGRLIQGLSCPITHSQSSVVHLQTLLSTTWGWGGVNSVACWCSAAIIQRIVVWIATALNQVDGELNVISALLLAVNLVVCLVRNSHDSIRIQKERSLLWVTKLRLFELGNPFHFMCCLLGFHVHLFLVTCVLQ
jgi:hypothetical protein